MAAPNKQELNKQIQQEINKLSGDTQKYWQGIADKLTASGAKAKELEQILVALREVSYQWEESLTSLQNKWDRLTKKFQEAGNELDQAMRAQRSLNSLTQKLIDHKSGEEKLSAKNLESVKKEFAAKTQMLVTLKQLTDEQQKQAEEYLNYLDKEIVKRKEIEKKIGLAKILLEGIAKIPILGELIDAEDVLTKMEKAAEGNAGFFKTMGVGVKALGANLMANLKNPLTIILALGKEIVAAFKLADEGTGELAKKFNITYDEAARTREQLGQIAALSMDSAINTKGLQESLIAVGQSLGSNAALNEKDLITFTKLREQAGFANEELAEMQKYTLATGGNLEDNVANLMFAAKTTALNNGVMLNEKDIMRDIAKTGNAVKLSIVGGALALGKATAEAKSFGMSLDQVDKIAGSLMDFESSINAELEAQLLTGKNINLEQARLYALNNDYAGLTREIAKNIGSAADFNKMNRIQQEAVAKAVGMTREELATTLTDQEALKGLSGEQAKRGQEALNAARARGMTEDQIAKADINNLMKQQDIQTRFNQSVEKLREIFVSIAEPILRIVSPLADLVSTVLPALNLLLSPLVEGFNLISEGVSMFVAGLKEGNPLALTLAGIIAMMSVNSIISAISAIWRGFGMLGPFGPPLAAIAVGGFLSQISKAKSIPTKVGDMYVPPDGQGKTLISTKEGGLFEPSPRDAITVAPPTKVGDMYVPPKEKSGATNNESKGDPQLDELKAIKNILQRTYEMEQRSNISNPLTATGAGIDFFMDKFGTKANVNTYKTQ